MNDKSASSSQNSSQQQDHSWAEPVQRMQVREVPYGALNLNLDGERLAAPWIGFGPLMRKTYRLRFEGTDISPEEVVQHWKAHFPKFQPPENRFYPTMAGMRPGELVFIDGKVPPLPGLPAILPVASGVLVLYADETSFSIVTPEGFPEAGYNTWSAYRDPDGVTVAQVQTFARTADPLYEFCYRFLGVTAHQDHIWSSVLERLADDFGVQAPVSLEKLVIDPRLQWQHAHRIYQNAAIRTVFYLLATPLRWIGGLFHDNLPNQDTARYPHYGLIDD
jgi:hypothetical protein